MNISFAPTFTAFGGVTLWPVEAVVNTGIAPQMPNDQFVFVAEGQGMIGNFPAIAGTGTLTYSLVGADAIHFQVDANAVVTSKSPLIWSPIKSTYSFKVVASNHLSTSQMTLTVYVNKNASEPVAGHVAPFTLPTINSANWGQIYSAVATITGPTVGQLVSVAGSGPTGSVVELTNDNGLSWSTGALPYVVDLTKVRVTVPAPLPGDTASVYVNVSSAGGNTAQAVFKVASKVVITVGDDNKVRPGERVFVSAPGVNLASVDQFILKNGNTEYELKWDGTLVEVPSFVPGGLYTLVLRRY